MSGEAVELDLCECRPADLGRGRVAQESYNILARGLVVGQLRLRLQDSEELIRHAGHVGYDIIPEFRGQGYAAAAVRLVLPRARAAGLAVLWITCDPANIASRRTAERAGAEFVEVVDLPPSSELYGRGERQVARYRLMTGRRPRSLSLRTKSALH